MSTDYTIMHVDDFINEHGYRLDVWIEHLEGEDDCYDEYTTRQKAIQQLSELLKIQVYGYEDESLTNMPKRMDINEFFDKYKDSIEVMTISYCEIDYLSWDDAKLKSIQVEANMREIELYGTLES